MSQPAADESSLEQAMRDGTAGALTARLGLALIVLTGCFVASLLLASVREVVTTAVSAAFPAIQVEQNRSGG